MRPSLRGRQTYKTIATLSGPREAEPPRPLNIQNDGLRGLRTVRTITKPENLLEKQLIHHQTLLEPPSSLRASTQAPPEIFFAQVETPCVHGAQVILD